MTKITFRQIFKDKSFISIILLGFVIRLAWCVFFPTYPETDFMWYHIKGAEIASGKGFLNGVYPLYEGIVGKPTAFRPIGYPATLAALYFFVGPNILIAKMLNVLLSVVSIILLYLLTRSFFSKKVSLVAICIFAFSPLSIIYTGIIGTETLFQMLLLVCAYFTLVQKNPYMAGLAIGYLGLVRPIGIYFLSCIAIYYLLDSILSFKAKQGLPFRKGQNYIQIDSSDNLYRSEQLRTLSNNPRYELPQSINNTNLNDLYTTREYSRLVRFCITTIVALLVLAPWIARNYIFFGTPVYSTNGGYVIYVNNNPYATGSWSDPYKYPQSPFLKYRHDKWFDELGIHNEGKKLAIEWIKENPKGFLYLGTKRMQNSYFTKLDDIMWGFTIAENQWHSFSSKAIKLQKLIYIPFNILVFISVAFAIFKYFKKTHNSFEVFIVLLFLYFNAMMFILEGNSRYVFPMHPFFAVLVASFVLSCYDKQDSSSSGGILSTTDC